MARLWIFGAESRSTLEYAVVVGTPAISTTTVHTGGASLETNGAAVAFTEPFTEAATTQYASIWFRVVALPASVNTFIQTIGTASAGMCTIRMNADGTLVIVNGASAGTVLATTAEKVTAGVWTQIQIKTVGGTSLNGTIEVIFAGVTHTFTGLTMAATTLIGLSLGPRTVTQDIFWDDIVEDTAAYPGVGTRVLARQPIVGTPTYNAWTKVGTDPYWADTPTSTTNAATSVANSTTAQTKLLHAFNTTQTNFGTDVIGASDTIGGMVIGAIAKRGTGTAPTSAIRYRYNGADTDTAAVFTTADAYYRSTYLASPTLALLNAMEAGGTSGALTVLSTIEDLWAMVDYIPATAAKSLLMYTKNSRNSMIRR